VAVFLSCLHRIPRSWPGGSTKEAFRGIFEFSFLPFPDNNTSQEAGGGQEERDGFSERKELYHEDILPEYFYVSGGGIKRRFNFFAYFFQCGMAKGIGIQLAFIGDMVARSFLGKLS
jgi:hypothetical protein